MDLDERSRPTKIQAAVLRAAQAASERTGTPGKIEGRMFDGIVRHFFREPRVLGAVEQLRRMGYVSRGTDGWVDLRIPRRAWSDSLSGDDPEPLSDAQLTAIIVRFASAPVEFRPDPAPVTIAETIAELPSGPKRRKPKNAVRRFVLLADHRLAETWYGAALPSPLSRAIVVADKACEKALLALRSKLALDRMMGSFPEPTGRHEYQWHVTPLGIAYIERSDTPPSLSVDRVHAIGSRLGYEPVSRSGPLGR